MTGNFLLEEGLEYDWSVARPGVSALEALDNGTAQVVQSTISQDFTSLKNNNIKVVHVVSSVKFASKSQDPGVDAIVAEGFEAGGHNGREETTTFTLIPMVKAAITLPLIAAGGIATGGAMLAAAALGADGVQVGSRFVASDEASCHPSFKDEVIKAAEGSTVLTLKEITPVRMLKNSFFQKIAALYEKGVDVCLLYTSDAADE